MKIIIHNAWVVDPFTDKEGVASITVEEGIITKIQWGKKEKGEKKHKKNSSNILEINAHGLYIFPGLIDMHAHLREPGFEHKETIRTGTKAAISGGFTTICCMANTNPVNDNPEVTYYILAKAREEGCCDVYPIGAITKGLKGEELSEMAMLREAGCVAFSDDGMPVTNSLIMKRALEYSKAIGSPIISHCEDLALSEGGVMNEGKMSFLLGLKGIPREAEEVMVARDILLSKYTKAPIHIAHVSTKGAIELIKRAKEENLPVTAETCPHYFTLTEKAVDGYKTDAKVNPPLRTEEDMEAIKEALKEDILDVIATDHAPHHEGEKKVPFQEAANGISGLETALSLSLKLVKDGILNLRQLIEKLTVNPAKILKISKKGLKENSEADFIIVDLGYKWKVNKKDFASLGKNTPFDGWNLEGKVLYTFKGKKFFDMSGEKN